LEVTARAKINLTLEVLGRRGDGYHEVKTILQTVDLSDRLAIEPSSDLKVECDQAEINGEDNLVWSAAIALAHRCGIAPRARIVIHKGIPVSMGLGGGSSDAAAALVALNQLWQLGLSGGQLAETAAEIGSDVSFFLTGGTALGEGRGELITQLPGLPSIPVTLICPNVALPRKTAAMYSLLNSAQFSDGGSTDNFARILLEGRFVLKSIGELTFNVFEQVADQALPELNRIWGRLEGIFQNPLRLAGSGPGMFSLPSNEDEFQRAAKALQPDGIGVYLVHTTGVRSIG
jgi:4-diphosphocytidyl-2-C-methyl-D-erythritol kinase